ncbi:unnamed protein product [Arctia plantaginis]|uniref:Uncharacterized protein n=1 Tax=Arctia plantaginis TaxID=874455 RepID=A0A8S1AJQ3_ARCPL|nr:unnamed protein product [Arctia plantaginis]
MSPPVQLITTGCSFYAMSPPAQLTSTGCSRLFGESPPAQRPTTDGSHAVAPSIGSRCAPTLPGKRP